MNCAVLPHSLLPQLIPSPRNFQTRIQKKHSNQLSMSSSSLQCYRGLAALSSLKRPGTMPVRGSHAQEGSCTPGPCTSIAPSGLLEPQAGGVSLAGAAEHFCAVLTAAEPIQWRNYTSASAAEANQPQSTLSLPKYASWLLAAQTDQSTELLALYSHRP